MRVKSWHANIEQPTVLPVISPEPILHFERFSEIKCTCVCIQAGFHVFRMNTFCPAIPKLRFDGPTREFQPCLIEVVALPIGSRHPDQHRRTIGDQAEALLTLTALKLRLLAIG